VLYHKMCSLAMENGLSIVSLSAFDSDAICLNKQIEKLIKPTEDSVRIYVLTRAVKRTITYGSA